MKTENDLREEILKEGKLTLELKKKYFPGDDFKKIRDQLEELGLDRHMTLVLNSVEIALVTPLGIIMQIRPKDRDQLGLWGGVLLDDESPEDGAVRELYEETGIQISKEQLEFVEVNEHFHEYASGDKGIFISHRYIVRFDNVPEITTDEESVGAFMVVHTILSHQQDFVKRVLGEK